MAQLVLRALGPGQRRALAGMLNHNGEWYPGCGWAPQKTGTDSVRIMVSLAKRDMVRETVRHDPRGSYTVWELTDIGRAAARTL